MLASELPDTATLVSPGVWTDTMSQSRYYLDPTDATLLLSRTWTPTELSDFNQAQTQKVNDETALRAAIADRVQELKDAVTASTSFQASETALATAIAAIDSKTITMEQVRDQMVALHTDNATVTGRTIMALNAIADLAILVSTTL